jgi:hypothetical protein
VGPGEWHDPSDPYGWRGWGSLPLRPASCGLLSEDEEAARQAAARLAEASRDVDVYRVGVMPQAHIWLPAGGSQTITRPTWRELYGKLTEAIRAVRLPPP